MTTEAFQTVMAILSSTFSRILDVAALKGYEIALHDLADDQLSAAVTKALRKCRFMPTPSELREFAADHKRSKALEESTRRTLALASLEWTPEQKKEAETIVRNLADMKAWPSE